MPSEKKSKRNKSEKVKIKKEPEEVKALSHYVETDDRVELIKQVFNALKPKHIKSRAPVNFQGKSIDRLQQMCLDEVLGISKKRLLSIINNTKCPTDTDSSDSDIERIEGKLTSKKTQETPLNLEFYFRAHLSG